MGLSTWSEYFWCIDVSTSQQVLLMDGRMVESMDEVPKPYVRMMGNRGSGGQDKNPSCH